MRRRWPSKGRPGSATGCWSGGTIWCGASASSACCARSRLSRRCSAPAHTCSPSHASRPSPRTRADSRPVTGEEPTMQYDFLYEVQGGIATVTFNRPEVLNALTFDVYAQLRDLFEGLRYDDSVKVVVLTGAGEGFCSGGDVQEIIGELLKRDLKGHSRLLRMTGAVVQHMRLLDKPIIAALNGMTASAGSVLALAADLRIGSDSARFAFLFTRVGLTGADMGAGFLLPPAY